MSLGSRSLGSFQLAGGAAEAGVAPQKEWVSADALLEAHSDDALVDAPSADVLLEVTVTDAELEAVSTDAHLYL